MHRLQQFTALFLAVLLSLGSVISLADETTQSGILHTTAKLTVRPFAAAAETPKPLEVLTVLATTVPTEQPTVVPTPVPTTVPTPVPTSAPTEKATPAATEAPTASATAAPAAEATDEPNVLSPLVLSTSVPTVEPTANPSQKPAVTLAPDTIKLQKGDKNDEVKAMQERLILLGFLDGKADGDFGKATEAGVKAYQEFAHTTLGKDYFYIDPEATPAAADAAQPQPTPYAADGIVTDRLYNSIIHFNGYTFKMEKGATGEEVKRLQTRLAKLYYLTGKIDGDFGKGTQSAVKAFQKANGISETGVADAITQARLYSSKAVATKPPVTETEVFGSGEIKLTKNAKGDGKKYSKYKLLVDVALQRVFVLGYSDGGYTKLSHVFKCSTGTKENPTPLGTFKGRGPGETWHYFKKFDIWAQYTWQIKGDILFHSVLFREKGDEHATSSSVKHLGSRASHGCVRLAVEDAKWIYKNCKSGTTVVVYNSNDKPYKP